jgi:two-component sensor histidine kinase
VDDDRERVVKRAKEALRRPNGELEARVARRTADLRTAVAERDVLLKEVHHRVKNNLQVVAALLHLRAKRTADPAGREAFAETLRRIKAMSLVHEALYGGGDTSGIDFAAYLRTLAAATASSFGMAGRVAVEVAPSPGRVDLNTAVPLGLAAAEAIANAFKHAFPGGRRGAVRIAFSAPTDGADGELTVRDDGVGLPEPLARGARGAGSSLAEALARQIGGRVSVARDDGGGSVWRLTFAAPPARAADAFGDACPARDRRGTAKQVCPVWPTHAADDPLRRSRQGCGSWQAGRRFPRTASRGVPWLSSAVRGTGPRRIGRGPSC